MEETEGVVEAELEAELVGVVASCATMGSRLYDVEMPICVREWMTLMLALDGVVDALPRCPENFMACLRSSTA